jgi:hypothetical protein
LYGQLADLAAKTEANTIGKFNAFFEGRYGSCYSEAVSQVAL